MLALQQAKFCHPEARLVGAGPPRHPARRPLIAAAAADAADATTPSRPDTAAGAAASASTSASLSSRSASYTATMAAAMPGPALTYNHEAGMNWNAAPFTPGLLIGSCPQSPADVARLARQAGVRAILSLQEESDLAHFGIDGDALARAAADAGVALYRVPLRDFDPASLRAGLPAAVAVLEAALARGGAAYVHCTAGLGRAPAVALAHAAWVRGERLAEAAAALRAVRPCNPRLAAIRGAGADLVLGPGARVPTTLRVPAADLPPGVTAVAVAGLDVGWGGRLPMARSDLASVGEAGGGAADPSSFWTLTRSLPPGRHPFKLVLTVPGSPGEAWVTTPSYPTADEGGNMNNALDVAAPAGGVAGFTRHRLLNDELLPDEAAAAAAAVRDVAVTAVPAAEAAGKPRRRGLWVAIVRVLEALAVV